MITHKNLTRPDAIFDCATPYLRHNVSAWTDLTRCVRRNLLLLAALCGLLLSTTAVNGQTWNWTSETVDQSARFTSLVVDKLGNVHIAYMQEPEGTKYGFRPVNSSKWFTMAVDRRMGYVNLALDSKANAHLCITSGGELWYSRWDGRDWLTQQIAPNSGEISYSCSVAISPDGQPHLAWYQYGAADSPFFLHIKYATLQDGAWMARTIDFDGETGKWNSMVVDNQGNPHVTYSSFQKGALKYATWDGKHWSSTDVDARTFNSNNRLNRGFGNAVVLDAQGDAHVSYFDESALRYAEFKGNTWNVEIVDAAPPAVDWSAYRSAVLLDPQGAPHIVYEDGGIVKHAFKDKDQWHIQVIASGGRDPYRYSSAAMDAEGTIFISYRDAVDGSLKVAVGRHTKSQEATAANAKKNNNQ